MTEVSVIIPTFNRARQVMWAVSSVLCQTHPHYEILVVDDGSTDGTRGQLTHLENHFRYLRHDQNLGVSTARNRGIRASQAPLIAFLDSDDYWLPEKLAAQVAFFYRNPEAVICQTEEIWIRKGHRVNPRMKHLKPSGDIFEASLRLCLVSPSAVMLKRSLLDEVGLFDEDLPACEDYDLWLRIACRYPVHLIKRPLVVKEGGRIDQLSSRLTGLDRLRVQALLKLITSGTLAEKHLEATFRELSRKCRIYGNGCLKRGRKDEGEYYLDLPDQVRRHIGETAYSKYQV